MKAAMIIVMIYLIGLLIFWVACRLSELTMADFVDRALAKHPEMENDARTVKVYNVVAWIFIPFLMPFVVVVLLWEQIAEKFGK